ncbi:hypothetical protein K2X85_16570 [bacterium]|nr:hypothetical protein [bacterium]
MTNSVTRFLSHDNGQTSVVQALAYTSFGSIGSIKDGQGNNVTTGPISRFAYTGRDVPGLILIALPTELKM